MSVDKTIPFYDLYMIYPDLNEVEEIELPAGYHYRYFQGEADISKWVEIEVSAEDVDDEADGYKQFNFWFGANLETLKQRMMFIVDESTGKDIATATAYALEKPIDKEGNITGWLHWVAVRKDYQGKGLGKALITHTMKRMLELGHKGAYLHSQTHSWLACKIYLGLGWIPYDEEKNPEKFAESWEILKRRANLGNMPDQFILK